MDVGTGDEAKQKGIEIFCCYAREDQRRLLKLKTHLMPLQREGLITLWADVNISAGVEWKEEIDRHLYTARLILLLVSPDFMASDYCYGVEMQRAMERHERGEARVIPIILRPVSWKRAPFGKLKALPADASPIIGGKWHPQDKAFYDVAEGIREAVEALARKNPAPQVHSPDQTGEDVAGISFPPNSRAEGVRIRQTEEGKTRFVEEAVRTRRTEEERQWRGVQELAHQVDEEHLRENERATHAPPPLNTAEARSGIHRTSHLPIGPLARKLILPVGLLLLVIGGSTSFFIIRNNQRASNNAHATVTAQATISAQLAATAQAQATADAIGLHNPYSGKLALDDPMKDNTKGYQWDENNANGGSCQFSSSAYHVRAMIGAAYFCLAQSLDLSNFTFQVQMTILKGDSGGIVFRSDSAQSGIYYLQISSSGDYSLIRFKVDSTIYLKTGSSTFIKTGTNQSNTIAIVAYNDFFYIYINGKYTASAINSDFSHGQIGVAAEGGDNSASEVAFRVAKVWTF